MKTILDEAFEELKAFESNVAAAKAALADAQQKLADKRVEWTARIEECIERQSMHYSKMGYQAQAFLVFGLSETAVRNACALNASLVAGKGKQAFFRFTVTNIGEMGVESEGPHFIAGILNGEELKFEQDQDLWKIILPFDVHIEWNHVRQSSSAAAIVAGPKVVKALNLGGPTSIEFLDKLKGDEKSRQEFFAIGDDPGIPEQVWDRLFAALVHPVTSD